MCYNIFMNKEEFIEKIKKETFWDSVSYYKEWNGYNAYIVSMDAKDEDIGLEQVILEKNGEYQYAEAQENLKILGLF